MPETGKIAALGWRQGAVIPDRLLKQMAESLCPANNVEVIAIVVSQDCDVVHQSYEAEPSVEVLIGQRMEGSEIQGDLSAGRNPRRLQLMTSDGIPFEFSVHARHQLDRRFLESGGPSSERQLKSVDVAVLRSWLAKRYVRAAFPDEFNRRLRPARKKIARILKTNHLLMTRIFLQLNTYDELSERDNYEIVIYVTASASTFDDDSKVDALVRSTGDLGAALSGCPGIDVLDHDVRPETEFTLADLREVEEWDFDYFSYPDEYPA